MDAATAYQAAVQTVFRELEDRNQDDLIRLLSDPEGARLLLGELPPRLPCPDRPAQDGSPPADTSYWRVWELCGYYYHGTGRHHEALALFHALYEHILDCQAALGQWLPKSMPLVWMRDCHDALGHPVIAKRYMMLTACEDALAHQGTARTLNRRQSSSRSIL